MKRNWAKHNARDLMRKRGTESARGDLPALGSIVRPYAPRRRPLSKAELRAEAAALVNQYRGPITKEPAQ
jgi:hypothetical protein